MTVVSSPSSEVNMASGAGAGIAADREVGFGDWLLGLFLISHVAILTSQRENHWTTDAWEHQRAVRVLAADFTRPGNPTYATHEPSIRYSPYTAVLAALVRFTGVNSFTALSSGAVGNTTVSSHAVCRGFLGRSCSPAV